MKNIIQAFVATGTIKKQNELLKKWKCRRFDKTYA